MHPIDMAATNDSEAAAAAGEQPEEVKTFVQTRPSSSMSMANSFKYNYSRSVHECRLGIAKPCHLCRAWSAAEALGHCSDGMDWI